MANETGVSPPVAGESRKRQRMDEEGDGSEFGGDGDYVQYTLQIAPCRLWRKVMSMMAAAAFLQFPHLALPSRT